METVVIRLSINDTVHTFTDIVIPTTTIIMIRKLFVLPPDDAATIVRINLSFGIVFKVNPTAEGETYYSPITNGMEITSIHKLRGTRITLHGASRWSVTITDASGTIEPPKYYSSSSSSSSSTTTTAAAATPLSISDRRCVVYFKFTCRRLVTKPIATTTTSTSSVDELAL